MWCLDKPRPVAKLTAYLLCNCEAFETWEQVQAEHLQQQLHMIKQEITTQQKSLM